MAKLRDEYACFIELAMDLVGGKWKMIIVWHLREGKKRFSELQRELCPITQKMLTQQLRELEEHGLIRRKVYPVVPPKVEYSLTSHGSLLLGVLGNLACWSDEYAREHGVSLTTCRGIVSHPEDCFGASENI